jgi:hypothetical protein
MDLSSAIADVRHAPTLDVMPMLARAAAEAHTPLGRPSSACELSCALEESARTIAMVDRHVNHQDPAPTVRSHAQLLVEAGKHQSLTYEEQDFGEPDRRKLRDALGLGSGETLELWLLADRSGSVMFDRDEIRQVQMADHFASFQDGETHIGIVGFYGFEEYVELYEFKPPHRERDRAMLLFRNCGGGGTPTAEAVRYATDRLRESEAQHKLIVVATDAPANDPEECRRATSGAHRDGIRVIGALKPDDREVSAEFMVEQFGTDWFQVDSYSEVPSILIEHLRAVVADESQVLGMAVAGRDQRLVAAHAHRVAAAAEAVLALGHDAAGEFYARNRDACDDELRLCAHYVNLRRTQLADDEGDRLLKAALANATAQRPR